MNNQEWKSLKFMLLGLLSMVKLIMRLLSNLPRLRASRQPYLAYHPGLVRDTLLAYHGCAELFQDVHTELQLVYSLQWRLQNGIDDILAKPIIPANFYRGVCDSQLIGVSGYTREGLTVFAIGAGLSTFDKSSIHYYVQSHIQMNEYRDRVILPNATKKNGRYIGKCVKVLDMSGLKLSALNQIELLTTISTIDDLNYPEKTITYYIANVPYVFSAYWKVVKPLLQERTKLKVQVLKTKIFIVVEGLSANNGQNPNLEASRTPVQSSKSRKYRWVSSAVEPHQ